jgi:hypothetical protein
MTENLQHKNTEIKPRTYYEELAELGLLNELIKTNFKFDFNNDEKFRSKIIDILYSKSPIPVPEIERINLGHLCEAMSYFLEYNKEYLAEMDYRNYIEQISD